MIDISSKFPSLESAQHLAYYFPSSHGRESDTISEHLLKFKVNQEPFVTKWVDLIISEIDSLPLVDFIVRVLSSKETSASGNTSLDKLGRAMAEATDAKYCPTWVEKKRQTQQLKFMGKAARQNELDGIFTFSIKGEKRGNPRIHEGGERFIKIMIIDDVTTTGSTIKEIYRTIHEKYPKCPVHAFVLGKTIDSWADGEASNNQLLNRFNNAGGVTDINDDVVIVKIRQSDNQRVVPKKGFSWKYPNNPNDLSTIKDADEYSDDDDLPF